MSEHVNEWLSPYFDGELSGLRLWQVESHLAECEQCQAELEQIRELSALLRGTAPTGEFKSTERFIANLTLNLPRQSERPRPRKAFEIGWWLIPFGVLATWAFLQVTFSLSGLVQAASAAGLLGSTFAGFQGNSAQTEWFALLTNLLGGQPGLIVQMVLAPLNDAGLWVQSLFDQYLWQVILAVIYVGWLVSWWFRQPGSNPSVQTGS